MKDNLTILKPIDLNDLRLEYKTGNYDIIKRKISASLEKGILIEDIRKKHKLSIKEISNVFSYKSKSNIVEMGYKNESYYTEEEMLSNNNYTYTKLSYSEKLIYKSL